MKDYVMFPLTLSKRMSSLGKKCRKVFGKKKGRLIPICISNLIVFIRNRSEGVDDTVGAGTDGGSGSFFGNMRGFFRGGRGSDGSKSDPIDVEYREVGPDDRR